MQKFNGSLLRQFPSLTTGNAAAGVQVSVYISGTNTLATLYATNNTAGAQLSNPLTTDDKGFYAFYAVDGQYRLEFSNGYPALEEQLLDAVQAVSEIGAGSGLVGQAASSALQSISSDVAAVDAAATSGLSDISSDVANVQAASDFALDVQIPNQINRLGLEYPPIAYTAGLTLNSYTKTYSQGGALYIWGGVLGTVTTGAFDETGWQPIQGDIQLRNDLQIGTVTIPLVSRIADVAAIAAINGQYEGQLYELLEYNSGTRKGGGTLYFTTVTQTPDNGVIFACANGWLVRKINGYAETSIAGAGQYRPSGLGGFWKDDLTPGQIHVFRDRVFIGDAAEAQQNKLGGLSAEKSWVANEASGFMTYFDTRSQAASYSQNGGVAMAVASRTSDNDRAGERNTIGFASYVTNDNTEVSETKTAWAYYGHAVSKEEGNKFTTCIETDTCSLTNLVSLSPYLMGVDGNTAGLWVGVGGETAQQLVDAGQGAQLKEVSVAIGVVNTASGAANNRFDKGLVFQATSLKGTDGTGTGFGTAIEVARGHRITGKSSNGVNAKAGEIRFDCGVAATQQFLSFEDASFRVKGVAADFATEHNLLIINAPPVPAGQSANSISITPTTTGTGTVKIQSSGADANSSLQVQGRGTGGVQLLDGNGTVRISISTSGLGFYGSTPIARPTVTGSRTDGTALTSLLTALAQLGLITNSTTA